MNRYELNNAAYKIDGFISASPKESFEMRFKKAKEELLLAMIRDIENVKAINSQEYQRCKKGGFR